jgi:hypothetical protein
MLKLEVNNRKLQIKRLASALEIWGEPRSPTHFIVYDSIGKQGKAVVRVNSTHMEKDCKGTTRPASTQSIRSCTGLSAVNIMQSKKKNDLRQITIMGQRSEVTIDKRCDEESCTPILSFIHSHLRGGTLHVVGQKNEDIAIAFCQPAALTLSGEFRNVYLDVSRSPSAKMTVLYKGAQIRGDMVVTTRSDQLHCTDSKSAFYGFHKQWIHRKVARTTPCLIMDRRAEVPVEEVKKREQELDPYKPVDEPKTNTATTSEKSGEVNEDDIATPPYDDSVPADKKEEEEEEEEEEVEVEPPAKKVKMDEEKEEKKRERARNLFQQQGSRIPYKGEGLLSPCMMCLCGLPNHRLDCGHLLCQDCGEFQLKKKRCPKVGCDSTVTQLQIIHLELCILEKYAPAARSTSSTKRKADELISDSSVPVQKNTKEVDLQSTVAEKVPVQVALDNAINLID